MTTSGARSFFLLRYEYVADVAARRPALRPAHLALCQRYVREGRLLLGGAMDPMEKGAVLVFHATKAEVESFVAEDVYASSKDPSPIVTKASVDVWNVAVGSLKDKV